ncbi:MAG: hypothetical protein VB018_05420 [Lachnospiraceae bacterium]|nr:hypothetical protein [Lachnospiraceae bacterium]
MKRRTIICIAIFSVVALISSGCGEKNSNESNKEGNAIEAEINQGEEKSENIKAEKEADLSTNNEDNSTDVDLTILSSTMVYAEVYNMMLNPDEYVGKTIKIKGPYYAEYWDDTQKYYHYVIISDATACCQSGIEFIWDDNSHVYPDEYPENETEIEIRGVFSSYEELGQKYYYLNVEDINECNE